MKINRIKNSKRNMVFGVIYRLVLTILPFINRTVLIYVLGVEYLGLNSLFAAVLNILNLAELGFGSAIVYSMYKPIADNDTNAVCALLNFYKKVYRTIGISVLIAGGIATIFIEKLVAGDVPVDINIKIIFLIQLLNVVVSYFFMAYKASILSAFQREDLVSKVATAVMLCQYLVQFALVFIFKNYYIYLCVLPICTVLCNIIKAGIVKKHYPQYVSKGELDAETVNVVKTKVKALFLHKIGGVVANSLDNIVISSFLGLVAVAVYNNYWYVYSSVCYFIAIFHSSVQAGLGNSIATEGVESNYDRFKKLNFVNAWIVGWCSCCMLCLYQPFMELWVGKDLMYPVYIVIAFVVYFYINMVRRTVVTFKEAAGLWEEDRYKPIISAVVNIVLNIILIRFIGILGVILSTVVSFVFVEIPWETYVLFKKYFKTSVREYLFEQIRYCIAFATICAVLYYICDLFVLPVIYEFFIRGLLCLILPNVFFGIVNHKKIPMVLSYLRR